MPPYVQVHERADALGGIAGHLPGRPQQLTHALVHHPLEQVLLGANVVVQRGDGDPRFVSDLADARPCETIGREQPERGSVYPFTRAVRSHRAWQTSTIDRSIDYRGLDWRPGAR